MKKIDIYIIKSFIKCFLLGTLAFLNIFILSEIFKVIGYIIDGKINIRIGMELLLSGIPDVLVNIVPLGVLLGGLMTVNKMASSLEIIALKTSGVSFKRIVAAPVILSAIMSIFMYWFNDNIVPDANKRKREIKYEEVYVVKDSRIKTEVFMKGEGNYLYYIKLVNGTTRTVNNIEIVEMTENLARVKRIIAAKKAKYEDETKEWNFYGVNINDFEKDETIEMDAYKPDFIKETVDDFLRDKIREKEMNIQDLKDSINFIKKTGGDVKKYLVELYKKMAYPFAAFIMSFIGLSLGSRYVRGASAVSIGLSVVIGYVYYVVMATFEAMGVGGFVSPVIGAWVPNMMFFIIGMVTMNRAEY